MAPIAKAFPTFSGALMVAHALGNFGEFSALIYFFHFLFLKNLMKGCGKAGFHLNQFKPFNCIDFLHPPHSGEIDTIKQSWIRQYSFNVHICTENE